MDTIRPQLKLALVAAILFSCSTAFGQATHHHPLSQHSPPGMASGWLNGLRGYDSSWIQPLKISVEGGGNVDVFAGSPTPLVGAASPATVGVNVGHVYRLRLSDLPSTPGEEVFPTVELLDRLHPPSGRETEFPIPIVFSLSDIRTALSGQLVTRVIYLEQPQIAQTLNPLQREIPQSVPPNENALKEADRLGRPMAIIRIGGRKPSVNSGNQFFGNGGTAQLFAEPSDTTPATVRMNGRGIQRVSQAISR